MDVGKEIAANFAAIENEAEEERHRQKYRHAIKILREIPSGTSYQDLTDEQRQAWRDHDDAVRWIGSAAMREP